MRAPLLPSRSSLFGDRTSVCRTLPPPPGGAAITEGPPDSRLPTLSGLLRRKVVGSVGRKRVALEGVTGTPAPGGGGRSGPAVLP